ncbi:natural cytotoxicity triggering receptor 3-like [Pelobates cultripes]|uniref:Natural cytotoxicity triggering receptor 3 n=2 Tax=Pelobates cultripes TaxID=61616 RepID=A0AAD1SZ79_PELCU|nr:natural cytotoxicity triggering receptor 3-like [Pelobates cultripes]
MEHIPKIHPVTALPGSSSSSRQTNAFLIYLVLFTDVDSHSYRMGTIKLLFALGALKVVLMQNIHVSQTPKVVTENGSTVTLQCGYTLRNTDMPKYGWYSWSRHMISGQEVSNVSEYFSGRVSKVSPVDFISKRVADIHLHRVVVSDTGVYFCEIYLHTINIMITGQGHGTFLLVTAPKSPSPKHSNAMLNAQRVQSTTLPSIMEYNITAPNSPSPKHSNAMLNAQRVQSTTLPSIMEYNITEALLQSIQVSQIPKVVTENGSTVTLQCGYTLTSTDIPKYGWYSWSRHMASGSEVSNVSESFSGRVSKVSPDDFIIKRVADIHLHGVDVSDTGLYFCEIYLQTSIMMTGQGHGTFLLVTDHPKDFSITKLSKIKITVGALVLVTILSTILYFERRKALSKKLVVI